MSDTPKLYDKFLVRDTNYTPIPEYKIEAKLPPGFYGIDTDEFGRIFFQKSDFKCDNIVDLPSEEYTFVVKEMLHFMKPETEELFKDNGFLYKRSTLLHGLPGTGKTVIVNRLARHLVSMGGVVFFNPHPDWLEETFKILDSVQPDTLVMVVIEELDEVLKRHEDLLLSLLDGEVQKNNIMFVATTNYIDNIPDRILRPGRFASVVQVNYPSLEARLAYLNQKLPSDPDKVASLSAISEGLSIDELKEVLISDVCLGQSPELTVARILKTKGLGFSRTSAESKVSRLERHLAEQVSSVVQVASLKKR